MPCHLCSTFLCWNIQDIVASNERIAVFVFQLTICILFGLIQRNIHVAVQTCQNTCEMEKNDTKNENNERCQCVLVNGERWERWQRHPTLLILRWARACKQWKRLTNAKTSQSEYREIHIIRNAFRVRVTMEMISCVLSAVIECRWMDSSIFCCTHLDSQRRCSIWQQPVVHGFGWWIGIMLLCETFWPVEIKEIRVL